MTSQRRGFGAAAALCGGLALAALLRSGARTMGIADSNGARLGLEMGGIGVALAGLAVFGALLLPGPPAERLGWRPRRLSAPRVAALVLGTVALSHALNALLTVLGLIHRGALSGIASVLDGTRGVALAVAMIGMTLGPGLGEELLCRGLLQRSLVPRLGAPAAIGIAALVFGALHAEIIHSSVAAVLGVYLGVIALRADSTRPSMLAHIVNNAVAVLGSTGIAAWSPPPGVSLPSGLAIAAVCLLWARPRRPPPGDPPSSGADRTPLQPSDRTVDG